MAQPAYHRVGDEDDIELDDIHGLPRTAGLRQGSTRRQPKVIWLIVFFLINSLAFGIAAVPRINLVVSLICRQTLDSQAPGSGDAGSTEPVVIGGHNPQCMEHSEVSSLTALTASYGNVISGVLSICTSTFLSMLSDRVGRIKIIAYSAVVLLCAEAVLVVLANSSASVSYKWLYLAYLLDGLAGSFSVIMAMASAYISDCTAQEQRNVEVGRMQAAMFIGIAVGPAISSAIVGSSGQKSPLLVFYICLVMRAFSLVYLSIVPESLPALVAGTISRNAPLFPMLNMSSAKSFDIRAQLDRINPFKWLDRLVPSGTIGSTLLRRNVLLLLAINFICYSGAMATSDVLILYPQMVFKWGNVENNMFMSIVNAFRAAVSALALPLLIKLFRKAYPESGGGRRRARNTSTSTNTLYEAAPFTPRASTEDEEEAEEEEETSRPRSPTATDTASPSPALPPHPDPLDRTLLLTALVTDALGYTGYALAPSGAVFTLSGALAAFGAVGTSTTEVALTKHVARARVGELMGGLGVLQAATRIVAPAVVNVVYAATVEAAPEVAFLGVAGALVLGAVLAGGLRGA
ncbi:uncharacterized protein K452DRAFT_143399 [Aplosporella prunicola CBS 121167]|uniref:Major facilitator superfamily (MFS) profile domain-containing protein n=1 Tax=Aplosporella prunicola CBS 121167 TaxID=1176127 RepID=A0A6A6BK90_9PEZI|nr:uncharacterized protein K452DRAFT_143399 [Aplosporella prunicola CBS 121167]KAF2144532.1 hypothetical protein K452DRAFT_143399 [Aplosporella prunicola CBS 121167]